ncbi:MAG: helix-turn-helix domain-containing protein [Metallosphaera yellowstonensis]|jgi:Predicted DNA binding protein|uniref:Putative DNA binding protein n=1 Tax=Metallosphaera yellowstonensis MK1 TaxID=671065 RepID=H2C1M8_9CREN|nr:helix-turn-helix domain-containing protein [Metallosphaera yellowstonensis]EHP70149.1 putative DNA binding protein [Metallosphaera yellowstonensis MK1]
MLKKVNLTLEHEGCWTESSNETVRTINLEVYPDKGYLRSWILSSEPNLAERMAREPTVKRVNKVYSSRGEVIVDFLNVYEGSVAGLLYSREVLILGNYNVGGREVWSFVAGKNALSELRREISSLGRVVDMRVEDYLPSFPNLTEMERRVLKVAISRGYIDYPREVNAEELARMLNLSKVTFLYHWRNAQKKILKYVSDYVLD